MKRFWEKATYERSDEGWRLLLDTRPVRTPARVELVLPTFALAEAVAAEWNAVAEKIDPAAMPMTGFANAAIDRVAPGRDAFVGEIAAYANSDLLCYRADHPQALVERQAATWDPILDWARARYDVRFIQVEGIIHRDQPAPTLAILYQAVAEKSDFELAALSRIANLSGSAIASLALAEGAFDASAIWQASIIDELWQEEQWGADDFALRQRADRAADYMSAARFLALNNQD